MSGTTAGTTSGTVLAYGYQQRKIIDHAMRKAGYSPQDISAEWIEVAQDLLFTQLAEYTNVGFPLWTRQQRPLPITIGSPDVPLPYGTVDALHVYWRIFNPWRGAATLSTGESANTLVAGQPNDDVTILGPNPGVIVDFGSAIELDTIGILPGLTTGYELDGNGNPIIDGTYNPILLSSRSYSAALEILVSTDGTNWINAHTLPTTTFQAGQWSYFDLEPSITTRFIQIIQPIAGSWLLNHVNFCLANSTQIEIGPANIDDYYDLPNRFFRSGMPNTSYVDRKLDAPIIKIWPTPNEQAFYGGTVVSLLRRYIQDPGSMSDTLEIPARWFEGVTARLGVRLMDELPDLGGSAQASYFGLMAKQQRRANLDQVATKAEAVFWSEERNRSPVRILVNLRPYTA